MYVGLSALNTLVEYTIVKRGQLTVPPPGSDPFWWHPHAISLFTSLPFSVCGGVSTFSFGMQMGSSASSQGNWMPPGAAYACCQGLPVTFLMLSS